MHSHRTQRHTPPTYVATSTLRPRTPPHVMWGSITARTGWTRDTIHTHNKQQTRDRPTNGLADWDWRARCRGATLRSHALTCHTRRTHPTIATPARSYERGKNTPEPCTGTDNWRHRCVALIHVALSHHRHPLPLSRPHPRTAFESCWCPQRPRLPEVSTLFSTALPREQSSITDHLGG